MSDRREQVASAVRVRLFGTVDLEGVDADVPLRPLTRALLARLALAKPRQRVDTEDLAKLLVIGIEPDQRVTPDKLSSALQQIRNAQWELRKRLEAADGGARLLGAGRRWVALEGVQSDYAEFLRAADGGDGERARAIAANGMFLEGIDSPWASAYRRQVEARLRVLRGRGVRSMDVPSAAENGSSAPRRRAWKPVAALGGILVVGGVLAIVFLGGSSRATPDASKAAPDVTANGRPVKLAPRPAARCQEVLPGALPPKVADISVARRVIGEVRTYYEPGQHTMCAKLVKPEGTALYGRPTYLALTLCGDRNTCGRDWRDYRIDAGPVVVPAHDGCVSWRVSMTDAAGGWAVRDRVGRTGCD